MDLHYRIQMADSKKIEFFKTINSQYLLNFTLHSKANACNIGTFIRFYMQMRVEKKHLPIDSIGYSHNSVRMA